MTQAAKYKALAYIAATSPFGTTKKGNGRNDEFNDLLELLSTSLLGMEQLSGLDFQDGFTSLEDLLSKPAAVPSKKQKPDSNKSVANGDTWMADVYVQLAPIFNRGLHEFRTRMEIKGWVDDSWTRSVCGHPDFKQNENV